MRLAGFGGLALIFSLCPLASHAIPMAPSSVPTSSVNPLTPDFVGETFSIDIYFSPFGLIFSDLQEQTASIPESEVIGSVGYTSNPQPETPSNPPSYVRPGNLALAPTFLPASVSASVPEPGSFALLLGGLAAAGIGMRRRARRVAA